MQLCLDDLNSKGNARDPACVMRNRIAAYLYSKEATEKPIPSVSLLKACLRSLSSLANRIFGHTSLFGIRKEMNSARLSS